MKTPLVLCSAVLSLLSFAAPAADFSYSYIEAGYAKSKQDIGHDAWRAPTIRTGDIDADGYYLKGSVELGQTPFYLFGGYKKASDDNVSVRVTDPLALVVPTKLDVDAKQFDLGFGYHHGLSDRVDLVTELSYLRTDLDVDAVSLVAPFTRVRGRSVDGDDYRVGVGIRGQLAQNFEGWIKAHYTDGDYYDSQFGGTLGVLVKFNPTWGVSAEAEVGDDNQLYTIGVRASF